MKRTIVSFLLVTLFFGGLQAKPVDVNTAKSLGIKFMNVNTEIKSARADLVYTAYADNGQACFYVFGVRPKGFVIVSADDRAKPILGYSTESAFSSEEIAEGLESFFTNYRAGFSQMMAANETRTEEAANDWNRLAATGKINDAKITREVPKMLTTIWNQSALYNDMCPVDSAGSNYHVYAGCVATAMAQIINFWQWPHTGREAYSYTCYPYGELYVDFENAHYRYELMPDFLDWTSTPEEVHAVAMLQYHAGVSVEMNYTPEGSGAYSPSVVGALSRYFRYDGSLMRFEQKNWYTNSEWESMLRENLDMGMPLYYAASGNDGGHAFVCDGYDDNNMFHFNWGWQGFDNGYYAINAFYLSHYSFLEYHEAIFGIYPDSDYYLRPLPVGDLQVEAVSAGTNQITFTAPSMTICEFDLDQIDSILILRNNEVIHRELNAAGGAQVTFNDTDALGICHYSVLSCVYEFVGEVKRDTILNGPTCEMTFHLHDSIGDGWIAKSISIVDSRGNAIIRLGFSEGSEATVKVEVPSEDELTLHWAYAIGGKDGESYFEMYDWRDNLVYATSGRPFVGELCRFYTNCVDAVDEVVEPVLRLYPNPVSAQFTIEGVEVEQVEVFNALGQCVGQYRQNVIDLSSFESGMYFLHISSVEGQVFFEKVIKK